MSALENTLRVIHEPVTRDEISATRVPMWSYLLAVLATLYIVTLALLYGKKHG